MLKTNNSLSDRFLNLIKTNEYKILKNELDICIKKCKGDSFFLSKDRDSTDIFLCCHYCGNEFNTKLKNLFTKIDNENN